MKYIIIILLFLGASTQISAQQFIWEKNFNLPSSPERFYSMSKISDTSVVVSGVGCCNVQSIFAEYRASGAQPWHSAGRTLANGFMGIQGFKSGYFFTAGQLKTNVTPYGSYFMLQRFNAIGDTLWSKKFTGADRDVPHKILVTNKSVFLGGEGSDNFRGHYTLMKTDTAGVLQWQRFYSSLMGNAFLCDMHLLTNGNLLISGHTQMPGGGSNLYLVEVNPATGDSLRSATIEIKGPGYFERHFIDNNFSPTTDGNYICSGTIDSTSATYRLGYVAKVDTAFNVIWSRIMRPHFNRQRCETNKVKELANGDFMVLTQDHGGFMTDNFFFLTRFSSSGQVISETFFSSQFCNDIFLGDWEILADGTAMIGGSCAANNQAYITRVGPVGIPAVVPTGLVENKIEKFTLGHSYPNPTSTIAIIPYTLPLSAKQAQIILRDITGRKVGNYKIKPNSSSQEVNLNSLSNGLYIYTLLVDDKPIASRKLSIIK